MPDSHYLLASYPQEVRAVYKRACETYFKERHERGDGIAAWITRYGLKRFADRPWLLTTMVLVIRNRFLPATTGKKFHVDLGEGDWYRQLCDAIGCQDIETIRGERICDLKRDKLCTHAEFFAVFSGASAGETAVVLPQKYNGKTNGILSAWYNTTLLNIVYNVADQVAAHYKPKDMDALIASGELREIIGAAVAASQDQVQGVSVVHRGTVGALQRIGAPVTAQQAAETLHNDELFEVIGAYLADHGVQFENDSAAPVGGLLKSAFGESGARAEELMSKSAKSFADALQTNTKMVLESIPIIIKMVGSGGAVAATELPKMLEFLKDRVMGIAQNLKGAGFAAAASFMVLQGALAKAVAAIRKSSVFSKLPDAAKKTVDQLDDIAHRDAGEIAKSAPAPVAASAYDLDDDDDNVIIYGDEDEHGFSRSDWRAALAQDVETVVVSASVVSKMGGVIANTVSSALVGDDSVKAMLASENISVAELVKQIVALARSGFAKSGPALVKALKLSAALAADAASSAVSKNKKGGLTNEQRAKKLGELIDVLQSLVRGGASEEGGRELLRAASQSAKLVSIVLKQAAKQASALAKNTDWGKQIPADKLQKLSQVNSSLLTAGAGAATIGAPASGDADGGEAHTHPSQYLRMADELQRSFDPCTGHMEELVGQVATLRQRAYGAVKEQLLGMLRAHRDSQEFDGTPEGLTKSVDDVIAKLAALDLASVFDASNTRALWLPNYDPDDEDDGDEDEDASKKKKKKPHHASGKYPFITFKDSGAMLALFKQANVVLDKLLGLDAEPIGARSSHVGGRVNTLEALGKATREFARAKHQAIKELRALNATDDSDPRLLEIAQDFAANYKQYTSTLAETSHSLFRYINANYDVATNRRAKRRAFELNDAIEELRVITDLRPAELVDAMRFLRNERNVVSSIGFTIPRVNHVLDYAESCVEDAIEFCSESNPDDFRPATEETVVGSRIGYGINYRDARDYVLDARDYKELIDNKWSEFKDWSRRKVSAAKAWTKDKLSAAKSKATTAKRYVQKKLDDVLGSSLHSSIVQNAGAYVALGREIKKKRLLQGQYEADEATLAAEHAERRRFIIDLLHSHVESSFGNPAADIKLILLGDRNAATSSDTGKRVDYDVQKMRGVDTDGDGLPDVFQSLSSKTETFATREAFAKELYGQALARDDLVDVISALREYQASGATETRKFIVPKGGDDFVAEEHIIKSERTQDNGTELVLQPVTDAFCYVKPTTGDDLFKMTPQGEREPCGRCIFYQDADMDKIVFILMY
jgi:hypothetical protein